MQNVIKYAINYNGRGIIQFIIQSDRGIWSQNGILIIQVIVSSDLKCVREEVNIAKP